MTLEPKPGLVIRYSYLWVREARRGQQEGAKDRPCAIVVARKLQRSGVWVMVAPVTHTPPTQDTSAVEIPAATKDRLGLDPERSWVIVSEVNTFQWPGYDLRPVPGGARSFAYGYLDRGTMQRILKTAQELWRRKQLGLVDREEGAGDGEGVRG